METSKENFAGSGTVGKRRVVKGECKMCGICCTKMHVFYVNESPKIEPWAKARGTIVQKTEKVIETAISARCPHLTPDNKCDLQGCGKPEVCKEYPHNMLSKIDWGLDVNKTLGEHCGYYIVEE